MAIQEKMSTHLSCHYMHHLHLADNFIKSDLHCIQGTHLFFYQFMLSLGIEHVTLVLLAPCLTL